MAIGLLFCACIAACDRDNEPAPEVPPRPIAWATVEAYNPALRQTLPGVLRAVQRARLSFEVAGKVETIAVDIGDHFARGAVLAQLERASYELQVQRAEAALAEASAVAAESDTNLQRRRRLAEKNFASEAALDEARAAFETARSRVGTAEASLALARERLGDTLLHAPFDGEVSARRVEPSQQVAAGQPILEVLGTQDALEVGLMVPETLIASLRQGTRHAVSLPVVPDLVLTAVVTEIGTDAGEANTYPVTLVLESPPAGPRPGMTAEVAFAAGSEGSGDRVSIPASAFLAAANDEKAAFVFNEVHGVVTRRLITIDDIAGDRAVVSAGLEVGERIATRGLAFLEDGLRVTLLGEGPARSQQRALGRGQ